MIKITPSILSADFARLGEQVGAIEEGGADWVHCDIMDGHFVPNLTFGPFVIKAVNAVTDLPLDVHLMIEEPDRYIPNFIEAGSDYVTVHQEACPHLHRSIQLIKELGAKAGVSINPATPVGTLEEIICDVDLVLLMSVNPGFGGQAFIPSSLEKVEKLAALISKSGSGAEISVDGGVDTSSAPELVRRGATIFVAGSAVYGKPDVPAAVRELRAAAMAGGG